MYIKSQREELWRDFLQKNTLTEQRSFGGGNKGRVVIVQLPSASD
jgi:hypothetical protein